MSRAATSLRWRLGLSMSLGVAAVLVLALLGAYLILRGYTLDTNARAQLEQQQLVARNLDEALAGVERRTDEFAAQIIHARPSPEQLVELLKARVMNDSETASIGVMLEPHNPVRADGRFAAVATYGSAGLQITDFVASGYGSWTGYTYWTKDWYQKTLSRTTGWWSDPYFNDAAGGQDTLTFDYPLRDQRGVVFGMIGVSIPLDRLIEIAIASGMQSSKGLRHVMADANGKILMAWDPAIERAYTLAQAAERTHSPALAWLANIDSQPLDARSGRNERVVRLDDPRFGRERLTFTRLPRVHWRLGSMITDQQLLAPLHASIRRVLGFVLVAALLGMPLLFLIAKRLSEPLATLAKSAERLAQGELALVIETTSQAPEYTRIASAVEQVRATLQEQTQRTRVAITRQLQADTQREQAIRTQQALLPADRVFFGPRLQCEIAGKIISESGIASSGYGFIAPAPGVCAFFLVSLDGHNLGDALHLAHLTGILPSLMRASSHLGELLRKVSEHWLNEGDARVDVRLLAGRLDLDTGHLSLASANHPAPVLIRADGDQPPIEFAPSPVIGAGEHAQWPVWHSTLSEHDRLIIGSPALLERHGRGGARFGDERITGVIYRHAGQSAPVQARALLEEARASAANTAGQDDLVVLVLAVRERE